jgi:hypothetical protein
MSEETFKENGDVTEALIRNENKFLEIFKDKDGVSVVSTEAARARIEELIIDAKTEYGVDSNSHIKALEQVRDLFPEIQ